jgi:CDP-diacylglycerol--serine O-phosphatidyltransferase
VSFIRRNIPNVITCGNLLCGCLAIVKAFEGDLVWAAYLVGIAAVLDFFDGFAARMLKVSSSIGKDLDSLADMVTFGVVPGVVMFNLFRMSFWYESVWGTSHYDIQPICYIAFLITVFSAVRLARFNNDTRQSDSFIGVPTPANAIFICSIPLILYYVSDDYVMQLRSYQPFTFPNYGQSIYADIFHNRAVLCGITLIMSVLLVAPLPLIALKFKHFKWKGNEIRFIFLIGAVVLLAALQLVGIPLVIVFYILISVINNILTKKKAKLPD